MVHFYSTIIFKTEEPVDDVRRITYNPAFKSETSIPMVCLPEVRLFRGIDFTIRPWLSDISIIKPVPPGVSKTKVAFASDGFGKIPRDEIEASYSFTERLAFILILSI